MKLRTPLVTWSTPIRFGTAFSLVCLVSAYLPAEALGADLLTQPTAKTRRVATLAQLHCTTAGQRLVTVGERGSVLLSDDGGRTLRQAEVDTSVTLTHADFVNQNLGWAVGHAGVVLGTRDGGEHWERLLDGVAAARLELEDAQAVAASSAKGHRLKDAERLVNDGADKPFLSVLFKDEKIGWVVGAYGLFFETRDSGKTWKSLMGRTEAAKGRHLYSILNEGDELWLVGEQGLILHSINGGRSFSSVEMPGKGTLFGLLKGKGNTLIVYGLKGHVYRTQDQGKHWTSVSMPPISITTSMKLDDGTLVLGSETGQLYTSQNDGASFDLYSQNSPAPTASLIVVKDGVVVRCGMAGVERLTSIHRDAK